MAGDCRRSARTGRSRGCGGPSRPERVRRRMRAPRSVVRIDVSSSAMSSSLLLLALEPRADGRPSHPVAGWPAPWRARPRRRCPASQSPPLADGPESAPRIIGTWICSRRRPTPRRPGPLADRMRPRTLDEVVGQEHLIGPGKVLARARGRRAPLDDPLGPARHRQDHARPLVAHVRRALRALLRGASGVKEIREVTAEAKTSARCAASARSSSSTRSTASTRPSRTPSCPTSRRAPSSLIGATTENPSFEVNAALLSRCRVFVLEPLDRRRVVAHPRRARSPTTSAASAATGAPPSPTRSGSSRGSPTATRGAR